MNEPLSRAPWLVAAPVAGETVVFDPARDALHLLDPAATAVWELLDGNRSITDVVHTLDVRLAQNAGIGDDVAGLIATLQSSGLLSRSTEDAVVPSPEGMKGALTREARVKAPFSQHGGFAALEHEFTIEADDPALEADVVDALRDLATTTATDPVRYRLRAVGDDVAIEIDGEPVVAPVTRQRVPHMLLWHVNQEAVRRGADRYVVMHAAAAERDGVAVVLPAAMERGKTTTVAGLVRAGYRYLSDELAALDPVTLRVLPYPKPLGIDPGAQQVLRDLEPPGVHAAGTAWQVPASAIRPDALAAAARPAVIVAPEYDGTATTAIQPMRPGRMVIHLADCTFGFREHARRDLPVLARLAEACACYRLVVSDLDDAVKLVDDAVDSRHAH